MLKEKLDRVLNFPWKETAKRLVFETPAEAYALAFLSAVIAGSASYSHENAKSGQIPLAFSEIGQNRHKYNWNGLEVPPLTNFYSVTNDVAMMVFEANNESHKWTDISHLWSSADRFGYELEKKVAPDMRVHHLISDYAPQYPLMSNKALQSLDKLVAAERDLPPVISALKDTWDESHRDVDKRVEYQERVCSGTGKDEKCHNETRVKYVYDYTIHSYDYHRKTGRVAEVRMNDFIRKYPDLAISEQFSRITHTEAENEWGMRESRRKMPGYKGLKDDDYVRLANTWADGSNLSVYLPKAKKDLVELTQGASQWQQARPNAQDSTYRTNSHFDSGPEEYQIIQAALHDADDMSDSLGKINEGIRFAGETIPQLNEKIKEFVNVTQHYQKGNANKLRSEIMHMTQELYQRNYAGGLDTEPSKWGMIGVWLLLGAIAGGAAGYGLNKAIDGSKQAAKYFAEKRERQRHRYDYK